MNFIEAHSILKKHTDGEHWSVRFVISGNAAPFLIYLKAAAAINGKKADIDTIPFGTLPQHLLRQPDKGWQEIIVLFPWDLCAESDWRSGIPSVVPAKDVLVQQANDMLVRLAKRKSKVFYLPAPIPPIYTVPAKTRSLSGELEALVSSYNIPLLSSSYFSLGSYLASGLPFSGVTMGQVAQDIVSTAVMPEKPMSKVLITDLDNVMWSGLAAEEGPEGINCRPEGKGFRHFLYQTMLAKLKASGILIAAVSRNDLDIAARPIRQAVTLLKEEDFIDILASYEPKSLHIKRLAARLNLHVNSFVFVDDNPVELAEVAAVLPDINCLQFPSHDDELVNFFSQLADYFVRDTISEEDLGRTEMYRRRLEVNDEMEFEEEGGDITGFLSKLQMKLTIQDRSSGQRERAVQLINKTNQFNLNGTRMEDEEVATILSEGGKLYTASLEDRSGTHGEILACLIDNKNHVRSFVLSCRIFQREVENVFTCWLIANTSEDICFDFKATERNTPIRNFLSEDVFTLSGCGYLVDAKAFLNKHAAKKQLFAIKEIHADGI